MRTLLLTATAALLAAPAFAQTADTRPQPLPFEDSIPAARDVAYPGTVRLEVDATNTARAIFRVVQTFPVTGPGPLTLLYPEWLPGNHAPRGPIQLIAGLKASAGGKPVAWRRDPSYGTGRSSSVAWVRSPSRSTTASSTARGPPRSRST